MDLIKLADQVKFKLEYIYIAGFDSFGHRIKACVCYVPDSKEDSKIINRYAYVKSGEKMLFLKETYFDNKFEFTYDVPLVMWFAFKEQYVKRLENLEEVLAQSVLGKKVEKLREQYTYNPFLSDDNKIPWWYTMDNLDKAHESEDNKYIKNEVPVEDRPLLEKVFANKKKAIQFRPTQTMAQRIQKLEEDPILLIEALDKVNRKFNL